MAPTAKGKSRQALFDAFKQVTLHGVTWATYRGERLRLSKWEETCRWAFVRSSQRGRTVQLRGLVLKEGQFLVDPHFSGRRCRERDIICGVDDRFPLHTSDVQLTS